MAKRVLAWFGLLAACASFGGCGKTGDDTSPIEQSELPEAYANLLCESLGSCCKASSLTFDPQQCRDGEAATLRDFLTGIDPKNVSYDAQAAGDCLAGIAGHIKCGRPDGANESEICNKVFQGKLKPGAGCKTSTECERPSGGGFAFCDSVSDSTVMICAQQPSAASVHGKAGQACSDSCSGNSTCFGGGTRGAAPPTTVYCYERDGLFCNMNDTCQPLLALGQRCFAGAWCSSGFCDQTAQMNLAALASGAGACAAPREAGEPCAGSSECKSGNCTDNAVCAAGPVTQDNCTSGLNDNN